MTVKHLVFFKLKPNVDEKQIMEQFRSLENYSKSCGDILDFKAHKYSSPEGLNKGYMYGFKMTFKDEASRTKYLTDPGHLAIKAEIDKLLDEVMAYDYVNEQTLINYKKSTFENKSAFSFSNSKSD